MIDSTLHGQEITSLSAGSVINLYDYLSNNELIKTKLREDNLFNYIINTPLNEHEFLYRGDNDYRYFKEGTSPYILSDSDIPDGNWGGYVYGPGLYLTINKEIAQTYAEGYIYPRNKGCAKNLIISSFTLGNDPNIYKNCFGVIMNPKEKYKHTSTVDGSVNYIAWNNMITQKIRDECGDEHDIHFIIGAEGNGTEVIWIRPHPNLKYAKIERISHSETCALKINHGLLPGEPIPDNFNHNCFGPESREDCPTTCEYFAGNNPSRENKLPTSERYLIEGDGTTKFDVKINCATGEFNQVDEAGNYMKKYLKYKNKYLKHKK